jgi:hypothetical protein
MLKLFPAALIAAATLIVPAGALSQPPPKAPKAAGEAAEPERWILPQIVAPGARAVTTTGQPNDDANTCSFPYRFWGYHSLTQTRFPNGDTGLHIIRVASYQALDASRTVFETDNFKVRIYHTHPNKNWQIIGRYGDWHLGSTQIWLESGVLSATPIPSGGETVVDPHPTALSTQPDLCKALSS